MYKPSHSGTENTHRKINRKRNITENMVLECLENPLPYSETETLKKKQNTEIPE